jgi:enoyl-CoA hydratase
LAAKKWRNRCGLPLQFAIPFDSNERRIMSYTNILVETTERVGVIRLNRPQALNALNDQLMDELGAAMLSFDADPEVGCIVITGSEKAFAAGADIAAMADYSYMDTYKSNYITRNWETILRIRKPVIAAVSGYALGGGCELAMMCDFIIAADNARFGQPEVKLGTMPGAGGTQRLPRAVSKSLAMDLCLTGRNMNAEEALRAGLVARVAPVDKLMEEVMTAAKGIASMSMPIVMMIKESINQAYETTLSGGIQYERRMFQSSFATQDQKEGMKAFLEKRLPKFNNL